MTPIAPSRSNSIAKGNGGRSLTPASSVDVPKLKVPQPVQAKGGIHNSRSRLPPHRGSDASAASTLVDDDLHHVDLPGEESKASPAYDTTVKILGGWELGMVVTV